MGIDINFHAMYLNETPVPQRTPWLAVPGFDINRIRWGSAHTILLGTAKDAAIAKIRILFCTPMSKPAIQNQSSFSFLLWQRKYMDYVDVSFPKLGTNGCFLFSRCLFFAHSQFERMVKSHSLLLSSHRAMALWGMCDYL